MVNPVKRLESKYEILEQLQEGGAGAIYKVRHRLLNELRVVRVLRPDLVGDSGPRVRFLAEARGATRVGHPNIAQIFDCSIDDDGVAFIVMELSPGMTLTELLAVVGPPPPALALEIARQSLRAIGHLHKHQVVHRDVSPDNLILTCDVDRRPLVKLIDLGIARQVEGNSRLTGVGAFIGKFRYAAPETFDQGQAVEEVDDSRSGDLYSFALVLYELLTGRFPIPGDSASALIAGHLFRPPLDFSESDPEGRVPATVRRALLKALAKSPAERFTDAEGFAAALELGVDLDLSSPRVRDILELTRDENRRSGRAVRPAQAPAEEPSDWDAPTVILKNAPAPASPTPADRPPLCPPNPEEQAAGEQCATVISRPPAPRAYGDQPAPGRGMADDITPMAVPVSETAALDQALRAIRALRDDGRAGEALELLNRTLRRFGSQPALKTLRYQLGEALLERDDEENSASQVFEIATPGDSAPTVRSATPPAEAPPRATPLAEAPPRATPLATVTTPATVPTPAAAPAAASMRSLSDATIRSFQAPARQAPERSGLPTAHHPRTMVAVALFLAAVFAALAFLLTRDGKVTDLQPLEAEDVVAADLSPGSLAIDAVPWAEIISLENPAVEEATPISPSRFTPVILSLAPGQYRITLRYPPTGQTEELVVSVDSDVRIDRRLTFESIDAEGYFDRIGW